MAIPDFQTIMLPLLKTLSDNKEHSTRQIIDNLAEQFKLTPEERKTTLKSGIQPVFDNRVGWANTYMKKAGLIEAPRRGYSIITASGLELLAQDPPKVDNKLLNKYEPFKQFRAMKGREEIDEGQVDKQDITPSEAMDNAYQNMRGALASDLLDQLKASTPSLFEAIVVDVLVTMGYGGNREEAGKAIGGVGDEGIDGIINEDKLGLDVIYVQAKKWDGIVGRPEIQKFAGALQGKRARRGIFITTSDFSKEARDFADRIDSKIILINGETLAQYMIDYNVGVTKEQEYTLKKIDSDYFSST